MKISKLHVLSFNVDFSMHFTAQEITTYTDAAS